MPLIFLLFAAMLSGLSIPAGKDCDCLPRDIQPSDIVSAYEVRSGPHRGEINKITVAQKLKEIRAGCRKGKLIDSKGKEIRFYRLSGCWGNPPDNYQEILERQDKELASLRKRYRVIEMTCNPSGEQIARISLPQ